ncbi:MAG: 5'-methylthioadenosine/S-adenosylhomocysteine nucleosidase [Clostridia bacterium]|nr:5'-methylthioadenosine/S-adenosylhomocysteine nucleosidase [Clostridia bacterium]
MEGNRPILVIATMDAEFKLLKEKLESLRFSKLNNKYHCYEGFINHYPVVICNCMETAINATIATTLAIQKYKPSVVINEGVAGGHGLNIHKGDIVIGENCINILSYGTPIKKEGEGSNTLEWTLTNFFAGEPNRLVYQRASAKLIRIAKNIEYLEGKVHVGTIGSGDIWDREYDRIMMLNQKYGTLCEDMEANSVYIVANQFKIPVIGIKIVSTNEILEERYERSTGNKLQEFSYELIKRIIKDFKK